MRIFASDRVKSIMQALGMERGEAIEHKMVTGSIEKAQRKVEGRNFDIRKQLLEYDNIASDQRHVIYQQRNDVLESAEISEAITAIREDVVQELINQFIPPQSFIEQWDLPGLEQALDADFGLKLPLREWLEKDVNLAEDVLRNRVLDAAQALYKQKCDGVEEMMQQVEKLIMLQVLDNLWKEHLGNMDHLRQGINLRAYAQKNPKQEYKRESFELFKMLLDNIKSEVVRVLFRIQIASREEIEEAEARNRQQQEKLKLQHPSASALSEPVGDESVREDNQSAVPFVREGMKVGRNEPCPCGSGKKYKQCHGSLV